MTNCNRRDFLKIGIGVLATTILPIDAWASLRNRFPAERSLFFYNTHTGEKLRVCYFEEGDYSLEGLVQINHILRDHRTDAIKPIDPKLLDMLYAVKYRVRTKSEFHVISGYRSPLSNEFLRAKSRGIAKNSFHTKGQAIDIRLPGYSTARLRNLCVKLKAGGVGYYPQSDFLHLDTGVSRTW